MTALYSTAVVLSAFLTATALHAQKTDTLAFTGSDILEQQIETLTERSESEQDYSDWVEDLRLLRRRPVNLNSGDENELRRLPLLNELQIANLLEYIASYGQLASIYELQVIDGFNEQVVNQMLPFITLSPYVPEKFSLRKALSYGETEALFRYQRVLQKQAGYEEPSDSVRLAHPNEYYAGSPDGMFVRLQYTWKDYLNAGLTAEKDAGEAFLSDTLRKGFDFYSAHLFLKNIGVVKQLALGDYQVQFGQGLNIWSGFSAGKSAGSVVMRKRAPALRAHASSNEYSFLRGAATTLGFGRMELTAFWSGRRVDANLLPVDSSDSEAERVSALQETGYHRTPSEIADKHASRETLAGAHLAYNGQRLRTGMSLIRYAYSPPFEATTESYRQFQPDATRGMLAGMDYCFNYKTLTLYGEFSHQFQAGTAFLQGLSYSPDSRAAFALIYRNYPKNYLNPFSSAFGESSSATNEKGLYLGMLASPNQYVTISAYADIFRYAWLHYRADAPSGGQEYSVQVSYVLSRQSSLSATFRRIVNPMNYAISCEKLNSIAAAGKSSVRIQLTHQPFPWLTLQSRAEFTYRDARGKAREKGCLFYQSFRIQPEKKEGYMTFRYLIFDTDSYDTRMYAFENDVPYSFSVPAFAGKGSRFYLLLNVKPLANLSVQLRYACTFYADRIAISSGADQISGNKRSDIKVMLKFSL
jgi:hypothetical protein